MSPKANSDQIETVREDEGRGRRNTDMKRNMQKFD
jgi:hypothetical protein